MSTEVHSVQKEGQRPKYKDYVSFLEAYKNGKRDEDGGNFSSNDSSSGANDKPKKSFREYLESYNSKRYGPVQPSFMRNGDAKTANAASRTENKFNRVNSVSKMFEKNSATDSSATKTVSSKVNQFEFQILNTVDGEPPEEQRKISIVEISKKFENNSQQKQNNVEQKVPLRKTNSITEKSKVFEESSSSSTAVNNRREVEAKKNIFNNASSLTRQKEENFENGVPNYPPPPPPPPQQPPPKILLRPPSPARSLSPPASENLRKIVKKEESPPNLPPPPPPQPETTPVALTSSCPPPPPPPLPNGYSTLPRARNGTRDKVDGIPAPSLDKNDPRVKKLVYGALRDMYGAYHDKANDYLATLPKNRVRKNNGLDSIINSIAAQGGLDKLSGRANPNLDVE